MTPDEADKLKDYFRRAILETMDFWAMEQFPDAHHVKANRSPGATDADLPHIFPAIDAQFDRLIERCGVTIDAED